MSRPGTRRERGHGEMRWCVRVVRIAPGSRSLLASLPFRLTLTWPYEHQTGRTEDPMSSDRLINRRFEYNGHHCTVADYDGGKRLAIVMDDQPHVVYSVNIDLSDR